MKFTVRYEDVPFDKIGELPAEASSVRFFRGCEHSNGYVDSHCAAILRALGAWPGAEPRAAGALAREARVPAERSAEFEWLFKKLAHGGYMKEAPAGSWRAIGAPPEVPEGLRAEILSDEPAMEPALGLIDAAAEGWPAFVRGERDGVSVLFNPKTLSYWDGYFSNRNPSYFALNSLAAHAAARVLPAEPLRILEVGGGLGSGAEALLDVLARAGNGSAGGMGRIASYVFTDIAPGLLRRGADKLRERFPSVPIEPRLLDLNRPLAAQKIAAGSFDLVFAVNTLHVVKDLVFSLRELRRALVPGGRIVLGEATRPSWGEPLYFEFVFGLLREFREFTADPECRPYGGFLESRFWRAALEKAGFEKVWSLPDMEKALRAYRGFYMAGITAQRPIEDA